MLNEALAVAEFANLGLLIAISWPCDACRTSITATRVPRSPCPLRASSTFHSLGQQIDTTAHLCESHGETNRRNESGQDVPDIDGRIECHSSIPSPRVPSGRG